MFYVCSIMLASHAQVEMLDELSQCAFRMGRTFAAEAEAAQTLDRKLELFQVFDRCFFSMRMGISLQLRLKREPAMPAAAAARDERSAAGEAETERAERDPIERKTDDDHLPREREREREVERASLPALIRALRGVVDGAAALPGPEPEDLPRLRGLLAQWPDTPAPRRPAGTRPRAAAGLRDRLAGSTSLPPLRAVTHPTLVSRQSSPTPRRGTGPPAR